MAATTPARATFLPPVLRNRNFSLLWTGQGASIIGDFFHYVALSWLVLQLTRDAFALGTVLAVGGIPRAIFMLVGGAITDRFSSRSIMILSDAARLALNLLLAVLVLTGAINLWAIYAIALAFGFVSAFFSPAAGSIMPSLVPSDQLQPANAFFQGSSTLLAFVGPVLAGGVLGLFQTGSGNEVSTIGLGLAFVVDGFSFLVSLVTLWFMRLAPSVQSATRLAAGEVLRSIGAGLRYIWSDRLMRWMLVVIAAANALFMGPIDVGIPVLARTRLPEGVQGFGLIVAAYAAGNLIGTIISGFIAPRKGFGVFTAVLLFAFGVGLALFAWITSAWMGVAIFLVLGIGNGYFGIALITLVQKRTPPEMLGRIMSVTSLSNVGLAPLSQAISGAVVNWSLSALFVISGGLMLLVALWSVLGSSIRLLVEAVEGQYRDPTRSIAADSTSRNR